MTKVALDDIDRRIGAEFLDALISGRGKIGREALPRRRARIGRRHQGDARITKCRQHDAERAAEADDA